MESCQSFFTSLNRYTFIMLASINSIIKITPLLFPGGNLLSFQQDFTEKLGFSDKKIVEFT